jgi:hypothetical protein
MIWRKSCGAWSIPLTGEKIQSSLHHCPFISNPPKRQPPPQSVCLFLSSYSLLKTTAIIFAPD